MPAGWDAGVRPTALSANGNKLECHERLGLLNFYLARKIEDLYQREGQDRRAHPARQPGGRIATSWHGPTDRGYASPSHLVDRDLPKPLAPAPGARPGVDDLGRRCPNSGS